LELGHGSRRLECMCLMHSSPLQWFVCRPEKLSPGQGRAAQTFEQMLTAELSIAGSKVQLSIAGRKCQAFV
jgi:hypothetical protein